MTAIRPDLSLSKGALIRSRCAAFMHPDAKWKDDANERTEGGTIVHKPLAALVNGSPHAVPEKPALAAMYSHGRAWLIEQGFAGDGARARDVRAEVAFAYDVAADTGRELVDPPGEEGSRWYVDPAKRAAYDGPGGPIRATEIPGRIDLLGKSVDAFGPFLEILDHKTHAGPSYASAAAQLELLSLAASRATGIMRVRPRALHLWESVEPHVEEVGDLAPSGARELDEDALDAIAIDLALDLAPEDFEPRSGTWCAEHYCPARVTCPATHKLAEAAMSLIPADRLPRGPAPGVSYSMIEPATTNDHAVFKLAGIAVLEAFIADQKEEVRALTDMLGGLVKDDDSGAIYSAKTHPEVNANLDVPGAREALEELGFDLAIDTTPTTTWTAIRTLAGKPGEEAAKKALEAIEGATKVSQVTVYRWRAPEKPAKAPRARKAATS